MSQYEEKLKKRGQCRYLSSGKTHSPLDADYPGYPGMHHWLELDNNPRQKNMDDFDKQKIIFPAIMSQGAFFAYDDNNMVIVAPGNTIISDSIDLKKLLKVLTTVGYWALRHYYMGGGIEGELKVNRLQLLPVPNSLDDISNDEDAFNAYHFTDEEVAFIKNSL